MSTPSPHFLLFSESSVRQPAQPVAPDRQPAGRWRFVLESVDGSAKLEADDEEPELRRERLELLAVVRGLEALDQPSRVTLVTPSRYVSRGLRFGLEHWRENGWKWERYGKMAPVKNSDLWRRVDQAMRIHEVQCRTWRFDFPDDGASAAKELDRLGSSRPASSRPVPSRPTPKRGGGATQSFRRRKTTRSPLWRRLHRTWLACCEFGRLALARRQAGAIRFAGG